MVPSAAWLKALSPASPLPAVGGDSGLTVGGLWGALLYSDAAVRRKAEQVLGCVLQPKWRTAAISLWQLPPAPWWVSPYPVHALSTGTRLLMAGGALQCGQMVGWLRWQATGMPPAAGCLLLWFRCPVTKGQQFLVKLPAPEHLVKEAPSGSDPVRHPSSSHTCLVRGGCPVCKENPTTKHRLPLYGALAKTPKTHPDTDMQL